MVLTGTQGKDLTEIVKWHAESTVLLALLHFVVVAMEAGPHSDHAENSVKVMLLHLAADSHFLYC